MTQDQMFKDFNFKLVVIEALLDEDPLFEEELRSLERQYTDHYKWYVGNGPIVEIVDYLKKLPLEESDLNKVQSLCFDGGNEIYQIIKPDWDGEDDLFEIDSVEGFQHVKNLQTVEYISMCHPKVLEPLEQAGIIVE